MKKIVLVAAMLLGFTGANATVNNNITVGTPTLIGSNMNIMFSQIVTDTLWWYVQISPNATYTGGLVMAGSATFMTVGVASSSINITVPSSYTTACYARFISFKSDPTHSYMMQDTSSSAYVALTTGGCTCPVSVTGTIVKTTMDSIYYSMTIDPNGGTGVVGSVTLFSDPGYLYGFTPQTYSVSGTTSQTFYGAFATSNPCTAYYVKFFASNPSNASTAEYHVATATACAELQSQCVSSCGCTINYSYKYGSMSGNRLTYTITYNNHAGCVQTQSFTNIPGCGSIVNATTSMNVCTSGWYTVSAYGCDASGHSVVANDMNIYVSCSYTSVEEVIKHETKPGRIFLLDLNGRCVKSCEGMYVDEINKIKSSKDFPPGLYVVKFVSEEGNFADKIFISSE
jgi:hypothetical protein